MEPTVAVALAPVTPPEGNESVGAVLEVDRPELVIVIAVTPPPLIVYVPANPVGPPETPSA